MASWPASLRPTRRPSPTDVARSTAARLGLDRATITGLAAVVAEGPSHRSTQSWFSAWSAWSGLAFASVASFGSAFALGSIGSSGSILSIGSSGSILSIGSAGSILSIGSSGSILSIGASGSVGVSSEQGQAPEAATPITPGRMVERASTLLGTCALVAGAVTR